MGERRLRPGMRRAIVVAAALAVVAGGAYASTYTSLFAADEIRVVGAVRIEPAELRRLAGVRPGVNVFHLDAGAAEARLARDPRIAGATVERHLPDGVTLRVVERIPVGRAEIDGAAVVVAGDGIVLPGTPRPSLPEIRAVAGELDEGRRRDAASVLASFPPILRGDIATVYSASDGTLTLETTGGVTVSYGPAFEVGAKAAALRAVLGWAGEKGVRLVAVDVTVPAAPSARTVDGSVTPG